MVDFQLLLALRVNQRVHSLFIHCSFIFHSFFIISPLYYHYSWWNPHPTPSKTHPETISDTSGGRRCRTVGSVRPGHGGEQGQRAPAQREGAQGGCGPSVVDFQGEKMGKVAFHRPKWGCTVTVSQENDGKWGCQWMMDISQSLTGGRNQNVEGFNS